jgi:hypothetical protein
VQLCSQNSTLCIGLNIFGSWGISKAFLKGYFISIYKIETYRSRSRALGFHSGDVPFESLARLPAIVAEVFNMFPQSLQAITGIVPGLKHKRFLKNSFQFIGDPIDITWSTH